MGNTVIVVEHDEETMMDADWLIDIGPGVPESMAARLLHKVRQDMMENKESITGQYLSERKSCCAKIRHQGIGKCITISGAKENNLKDITVKIPLNTLTCVTGVSGSGKSTLVNDILAKSLAKDFTAQKTSPRTRGNRWRRRDR